MLEERVHHGWTLVGVGAVATLCLHRKMLVLSWLSLPILTYLDPWGAATFSVGLPSPSQIPRDVLPR